MSYQYFKFKPTYNIGGAITNLNDMMISEIEVADATNIIWGTGSTLGVPAGSSWLFTNNINDGNLLTTRSVLQSSGANDFLVLEMASAQTPTRLRYGTYLTPETMTRFEFYGTNTLSGNAANNYTGTAWTLIYQATSDLTVSALNNTTGRWAANGDSQNTSPCQAAGQAVNTPATFYSLAGGGGGGDPYVKTLSGQLYKLDNISGFCRMLQGTTDFKNFVLNVEMTMDSKAIEDDMNEWGHSLSAFDKVHKETNTCQTMQSFFTKVYVEYGSSKFLFDIVNFSIVYAEGDGIVHNESFLNSGSAILEMYKADKPDKVLILHCGSVRIHIRRYPNKQIRSEVIVTNHDNIQNKYGFITMPMRTKDCRLKKLNDSRMLKQVDKQPQFKRQVEETFYTAENSEIQKKRMKINMF
jgi:hypothetical protein